MRTVVLFPVLKRAGLDRDSLRVVAWFGPRGLSTLLLVLLPVFDGIPGSDATGNGAGADAPAEGGKVPEGIGLEEVQQLRRAGEQIVILGSKRARALEGGWAALRASGLPVDPAEPNAPESVAPLRRA